MSGAGPLAGRVETRLATPFAVLGIATDSGRIISVRYLPRHIRTVPPHDKVAERACREIERYLDDPLFVFTVPYHLQGTDFQLRVWRQIEKIKSTKSITYGDIARRIQSAARAVGGACGANPVPLIVPCHRVLAAGKRLGGFMGGKDDFPLTVKRWLLRHEGHPDAAH